MSSAKLAHFEENKHGTDYVVGDIHGCFKKLETILAELGFKTCSDRLFSVGDLVDRGPDSEDALEWLAKPWFHAVRGNHEQMAIDYVSGYGDSYYERNGGVWMTKMFKSNKEHAKLFAEAFSKLPIALDVRVGEKLYGIIHAECPTKSWKDLEQSLSPRDYIGGAENVAMWCRDRYHRQDIRNVEDVDTVFVGHTPLKEVLTLGNVVYIDTGACFESGKLTVMKIY